MYTDKTGRLPVTPKKSNNYILVAYHYGSNTIHAEPLNKISGLDLTTAYQNILRLLTNRYLRPHLHILDNECPNILKIFIREVNKKISVSPAPHPLEKLSRTSHPNFQGEFHSWTLYQSQGPVESIFSERVHLTPTIQNTSCRLPKASYLSCAIS